MGESVIHDVLSVIRQRQEQPSMDIKPPRRIFVSDMEVYFKVFIFKCNYF